MTKEFASTLAPPVAPQGAVYAALTDGELLPCPCCGGEAQEYDRFNANRVSCKSCGLYLRQSEQGSGDAAARWNRRASHGQAPAQAAPSAPPVPSGWSFDVKRSDGRVWLTISTPHGASATLSAAEKTGNGGVTIVAQVLDCLSGSLAAHTAVAGLSEAVKFTDQSTADPVEKARRYLTAMGSNHLHSSYFFDDGYPKQESATDALATLAVLEQLAAAPTTYPSHAAQSIESDGWLHENGMLYRLTDERYPTNRDEINVTMADGSRSIESRSRRAMELLNRIRGVEQ